jgi:hypothetical protein
LLCDAPAAAADALAPLISCGSGTAPRIFDSVDVTSEMVGFGEGVLKT